MPSTTSTTAGFSGNGGTDPGTSPPPVRRRRSRRCRCLRRRSSPTSRSTPKSRLSGPSPRRHRRYTRTILSALLLRSLAACCLKEKPESIASIAYCLLTDRDKHYKCRSSLALSFKMPHPPRRITTTCARKSHRSPIHHPTVSALTRVIRRRPRASALDLRRRSPMPAVHLGMMPPPVVLRSAFRSSTARQQPFEPSKHAFPSIDKRLHPRDVVLASIELLAQTRADRSDV